MGALLWSLVIVQFLLDLVLVFFVVGLLVSYAELRDGVQQVARGLLSLSQYASRGFAIVQTNTGNIARFLVDAFGLKEVPVAQDVPPVPGDLKN